MIIDAVFKEEEAMGADFGVVNVVDEGGNADYSLVANALNGNVSGNPIFITDVSPLKHELKVKTNVAGAVVTKTGKNLLPYPYNETTITRSGITFTDNGDGTIVANGKAEETAVFRCQMWANVKLNAGSYFFSGCPIGGDYSNKWSINIAVQNESKTILDDKNDIGNGLAITVQEEIRYIYAVIRIAKGVTVSNLVFKPQLELGAIATDFEPYAEPTTYTADENGNVKGVTSLYPTTILVADGGATIAAEYNKDINKACEVATFAEPSSDDIPKVFLSGTEFSNMTTDKNEVNMELDYVSKTDKFHSYIKIKYQGSSSLSYDKKNFTIKMYADDGRKSKLNKVFKDWENASNKYVLKANWVDHSHARNIICANLWSEVVESRADYNALPEELRNSPRNGAIDGFPVKVYVNGIYQGIYTWNIGKDDWMWGMVEDNANHVLLCGESNRDNTVTTDIETAANFLALWSGTDGDDWSVEVGTNSDAVKNSLNALISCVKDTDDETFKATIGNHLDIQSAIDYYLFVHTVLAIDNLARNMLLGTFDGTKWYCGAYDLDNTWGWYDGRVPEDCTETHSLLWQRIEKLYADELKARYAELRNTVFSHCNIISKVEHFMETIGSELYAEDLTIYPAIPNHENDTIAGFRSIIAKRRDVVDLEVSGFGVVNEYYYVMPEPTVFDGSTTYIEPNVKLFDSPKDFTIFIAFETEGQTDTQSRLLGALADTESAVFSLVSQGNFFAVNTNGTRNKTEDEINGNWGHTWARTKAIALVFKGGVFQFGKYLKNMNGTLSVLGIAAHSNNTYVATNEAYVLGAMPKETGGHEHFWNGTINDFRIYNRALTEDEVVAVINESAT